MARAVAARTDFLGALSHLVRVYGDGGVDGRVRGARGVRYLPSPGDGKHGSTRGNRGRDARKREHAGCRGHAARATRESSRGRVRGRDTRVRVASGRSRTCTDADVRLEEGRRASDERVLREWRPHFIKLVSDNSRETARMNALLAENIKGLSEVMTKSEKHLNTLVNVGLTQNQKTHELITITKNKTGLAYVE